MCVLAIRGHTQWMVIAVEICIARAGSGIFSRHIEGVGVLR